MSNWYVYLIKTKTNKYYCGITTNVTRRFNEHCAGSKGAKFFRGNPPLKIEYIEEVSSRSEASSREIEIKKMTRSQKIDLINNIKNIN